MDKASRISRDRRAMLKGAIATAAIATGALPAIAQAGADPLIALCAEWHRQEAVIEAAYAAVARMGRHEEELARERELAPMDERHNELLDRISEMQPITLSGYLAQLSVMHADLRITDDDTPVCNVLSHAARFAKGSVS